jgi:putative nucleotidyltransferase with HDIG domain
MNNYINTIDPQHCRDIDRVLYAFVLALDLKCPAVAVHSTRVLMVARSIAARMEMVGFLNEEEVQNVSCGAYVHDIGKLGIPDAILHKAGELTPIETKILRNHCVKGAEALTKFPFLKGVAEIVLAHHEHFSGDGYPRGLKGEEIPIEGRIIAVANAFDLMVRPALAYRRASSIHAAKEEIERSAGTQFDPFVVDYFFRNAHRSERNAAGPVLSGKTIESTLMYANRAPQRRFGLRVSSF